MTHARALGLLLVGTAAVRLAVAASLGPGNDEAYYALYLRHPDWSYFDQPPMLAVVAALGRWAFGSSILALRAPFVLLFAGSTWLTARLARRGFGPEAAIPAAIALNAALYFGIAVGGFVLPDGPLLFFWLLTLDRLATALEVEQRAEGNRARLGAWLGVGLAFGLTLISKYHGVFLGLSFLLFACFDRAARRSLWGFGPYLAALVGLLIFAPVIVWNAAHGWASFAFQGGRAVGDLRFRPLGLLGAIGAQAVYLTPWMALALVKAAARCARPRPRGFGGEASAAPGDFDWGRFLLSFSVVPFGFFLVIAAVRPVLPHWGLIGVVALLPAVGGLWAERLAARPRAMRRRLAVALVAPALIAALSWGHVRFGWFQAGPNAPALLGWIEPERDPSRDLVGWERIAEELGRRGLLDRPDVFVFSRHWPVAGQLAFALGPEVPVVCYHESEARGFAFWSRPEERLGEDGILVAIDDRSAEPQCFDRWFGRIEPIAAFDLERGGAAIRPVRIFRCRDQRRPFPFRPFEPDRTAAVERRTGPRFVQ